MSTLHSILKETIPGSHHSLKRDSNKTACLDERLENSCVKMKCKKHLNVTTEHKKNAEHGPFRSNCAITLLT